MALSSYSELQTAIAGNFVRHDLTDVVRISMPIRARHDETGTGCERPEQLPHSR